MPERVMDRKRTSAFQVLRVLLVIGIVAYHGGYILWGEGDEICSFFFVLAGFLYQPKPYVPYLWGKVRKFYPFYLLCIGLFFLLNPAELRWSLLPHLLLVQSWIPTPVAFYFSYVGVAWFLSSLMFCYLCFPLLARQVKRCPPLFVVLPVVVLALVQMVDFGAMNVWMKYVNPLYRLLEYTAGYALACWMAGQPRRECPVPVYGLLFVLYLLLLRSGPPATVIPSVHLLMCAWLYLYGNSRIDRLFSADVCWSLARWSMYVFLSHQVLFHPLGRLGCSGVALVVTVVIASFLLGILFSRVEKWLTV